MVGSEIQANVPLFVIAVRWVSGEGVMGWPGEYQTKLMEINWALSVNTGSNQNTFNLS